MTTARAGSRPRWGGRRNLDRRTTSSDRSRDPDDRDGAVCAPGVAARSTREACYSASRSNPGEPAGPLCVPQPGIRAGRIVEAGRSSTALAGLLGWRLMGRPPGHSELLGKRASSSGLPLGVPQTDRPEDRLGPANGRAWEDGSWLGPFQMNGRNGPASSGEHLATAEQLAAAQGRAAGHLHPGWEGWGRGADRLDTLLGRGRSNGRDNEMRDMAGGVDVSVRGPGRWANFQGPGVRMLQDRAFTSARDGLSPATHDPRRACPPGPRFFAALGPSGPAPRGSAVYV